MNYISSLTVASGTYMIKDSFAREKLSNIASSYILIGDSYGDGYTPDGNVTGWCQLVKNNLEKNGYTVYTAHKGGACFANSANSYLSLIQGLESTITEKTKIKKIIVAGGWNEIPYAGSPASITSFVNAFINYCNTTYPNAVVINAMVGFDFSTYANQRALTFDVVPAYENIQNQAYVCAKHAPFVVMYRNMCASDGYHPNVYGQRMIASYIYGLCVDSEFHIENRALNVALNGAIIGGNCYITSSYNDNVGMFNLVMLSNITTASFTGGQNYAIYTPAIGDVIPWRAPELYADGLAILQLQAGGYEETPVRLSTVNGALNIMFTKLNSGKTGFQDFSNVVGIQCTINGTYVNN